MPFLSTTLIKISLILFATSYIAIAGPVPDVGSDISVGREQLSGGSESNSNQDAGGDFFGSLSGNGGQDGKFVDPKKPGSHNKGVGGSSLAGTRHKQGNTVGQSADPFNTFGGPTEGESTQGGSVSEGGGGLLNILSGNGGAGRGSGGIGILDILRKRIL